MHEFNQSLKYDQRMHNADIRGSIAYAKALKLVGILTQDEQNKIVDGLTKVGREWEQGEVRPDLDLGSTDRILREKSRGSSKYNLMTKTSTPRMSAG